jgi:hypothetical protein
LRKGYSISEADKRLLLFATECALGVSGLQARAIQCATKAARSTVARSRAIGISISAANAAGGFDGQTF